MDGGPIPALQDLRPVIIVVPAPNPGCNFCGAGSWNANSPTWCDHEEAQRTGPIRATEKWVCVMCTVQSSNWDKMVGHLYRTGHGIVCTHKLPPEPPLDHGF